MHKAIQAAPACPCPLAASRSQASLNEVLGTLRENFGGLRARMSEEMKVKRIVSPWRSSRRKSAQYELQGLQRYGGTPHLLRWLYFGDHSGDLTCAMVSVSSSS